MTLPENRVKKGRGGSCSQQAAEEVDAVGGRAEGQQPRRQFGQQREQGVAGRVGDLQTEIDTGLKKPEREVGGGVANWMKSKGERHAGVRRQEPRRRRRARRGGLPAAPLPDPSLRPHF